MLRPGRLDRLLYVGVAEDWESKHHVLCALTRSFKLAADVDLQTIARVHSQQISWSREDVLHTVSQESDRVTVAALHCNREPDASPNNVSLPDSSTIAMRKGCMLHAGQGSRVKLLLQSWNI